MNIIKEIKILGICLTIISAICLFIFGIIEWTRFVERLFPDKFGEGLLFALSPMIILAICLLYWTIRRLYNLTHEN